MPAGELRVGETLRNLDGDVRIESIEQLGSEERVYNLEIHGEHVFLVASSGVLVHNSSGAEGSSSTVGRSGAFGGAKRDAGIPRSQQPDSVSRIPMTDRNGKAILGSDGKPIMTREYTFTRPDGSKVVIQDHFAGHNFGGVGDQGPHFNDRPPENTRTGKVSGTQPHYPFER